MTDKERLKSAIENGEYVVFFGGAGVSTASGIPDFRGANGIFTAGRRFSAEQIVSSGFFYAHPKEFYDFLQVENAVSERFAEQSAPQTCRTRT